MEKIKEAKLFHRYEGRFGDEFLPRITTTLVYRLLRELLYNRFYNSNYQTPKWFELSAHDTNIAAFLQTILTESELWALSKEHLLIDYAAHLELEFYQIKQG